MINLADSYLDKITMYRLVLYVLIAFVGAALIFSILGFLPYSPWSIIFSVIFILIISLATNAIFAKVYSAPTNLESVYITSLILALIVSPAQNSSDLILLGWVAVLAMVSKYILAIKKKHLFNPAAIAPLITSIGFGGAASWWVGNAYLAPFVAVGGYLIVRKIRRGHLAFSFILTVFVISFLLAVINSTSLLTVASQIVFHSSLLFFSFIMLTEPLTTPPTRNLRITYAIFTGLLFIPQAHIGNVYSTPELALILGNTFSYLASPKDKLILYLKGRVRIAPDIFDFIFQPQKKLAFQAGQYLEWTLPHNQTDSRGSRRYFTLASSPTEETIRIGVKFNMSGSSSYKRALYNMGRTPIVASQLSGDFTLPENKSQKLAFLAGGIGITPYRSMVKYLLDTNQPRPITLIYSSKKLDDFVYNDIFSQAEQRFAMKTVYTITDESCVPSDWTGQVGRVDSQLIEREIPDYKERFFYLSGPHAMVESFENTLRQIGVRSNMIKKDYFPGF